MKILTIIKHSKFEWEKIQFGWTDDELKNKLIKEKANLDTILKSHDKQLEVRENFKNIFKSDFLMLDEVKIITGYDLIIVLGGDNSFTNISHHIKDAMILGVNSDPERSVGSLTKWSINNINDIKYLSSLIENKKYGIESWTRLKAKVDGKDITQATSEYFLGEKLRSQMSRHILELNGKKIEQKCSGLLIATGVGSTGWYKSASKSPDLWPKDALYAKFLATELYSGDVKNGYISGDDILKIYSLNDNDGCLSVDAWEHILFERGMLAEISIGSPLKVLIPGE